MNAIDVSVIVVVVFVLGIIVGLIGSPFWEAKVRRDLERRRLKLR